MKTLALITALLVSTPAVSANGGGWWSDVFDQKTVTLETILQNPSAFRGMDVSFVIQFHQLGTIENPYYTRFEKETYVNFAAWSDAAALWDKPAYEADYPYFFIDRIAKESAEILTAQVYDRFVVTGRVESVFRGKPWLEIVGLKKLEEKVDEPALIRMVKAYRLKKMRRFDAAAIEFAGASNLKTPAHVAGLMAREQGLCLAAVNRFGEALVPLEKALAVRSGDTELEGVLVFCREQVKKAPNSPPADSPEVAPDGDEDHSKDN